MKSNILFITLFVLSILLISGCKSEEIIKKDLEPMANTKIGEGSINRNEIGGSNLIVVSVHKPTSQVLDDGKFTTIISNEGAQLIFVQDEQKKLRATAVSLPKYANNIIFDAKSTAKASIFMTPGILAINPEEAEKRLRTIEQLSCFQNLHSFLKNKLLTTSLTELATDPNYSTLLRSCINETSNKI
jgi:hypothetical protein